MRRAERLRSLARAAAALLFASLSLALLLREDAGADSADGLLPEGLDLPPAEELIPFEGELRWNGSPLESLAFRTDASPAAVVRHFRARWEERAVELVEREGPEGSSLIVFDFHEGMRWSIAARRLGDGRTEAIRSIAPLGAPEATPLPFALPTEWEPVSRTEDEGSGMRVITQTAMELERGGEPTVALCRAARAAGWEGACEADLAGEPPGAAKLHRPGERLWLGLSEGAGPERWLHLRWEAE